VKSDMLSGRSMKGVTGGEGGGLGRGGWLHA
jgi:hypothetical protein